MYYQDWDSQRNPYDVDKIDRGFKATKKVIGKAVDFSKGEKRNFTKLIKGSVGEAFTNIQRENDKADYIK